MKAVKYKKGGKFTVTSFHWMEEGGRDYLMKGDYVPHPGAVKKATFKMADHPKKK